jgi:hypothetical protein
MTKLEQIARAMFDAHNASRPHAAGLTWDDNSVDWERAEYIAMARAAVEAMREPGETIIVAVDALPGSQEPMAPWVPPFFHDAWSAALDAILSEKPE